MFNKCERVFVNVFLMKLKAHQPTPHITSSLFSYPCYSMATPGLYIDTNTLQVGIGTTRPQEAFHVQGNLLSTGNITSQGTVTASNLSILGDFVTLNTITSNTEQMVIQNAGTGPALKVTQTGANSIAEFYDDGNALALKIADGGNVGIGTANPQAKMHVVGTASITGNTIVGGDTSTNNHTIQGSIAHTYNGTQSALMVNQKGTGKIFELQDLQVPVFTVLDGGYVGIGTTNPGQNLHISSTNVETNMRFENTSTNGKIYEIISGGSGGTFEGGRFGIYCRTDGIEMLTTTSKTSVTAGGMTGSAVGFPNAGFWIDRGWSDYPCITVTNTNKTGNTNQAQLRLHGTNASYASYPSAGGADFSCSMYIDGTYQSASDRRFKTNITSITNALSKVMAMDGKRYQIINSQGDIITSISANNYKFGFIAQDIQDANLDEIYLHYPNEDDGTNGYNKAFSLDYGSISALLVNAVKEQQEQIKSLNTRLNALESKAFNP